MALPSTSWSDESPATTAVWLLASLPGYLLSHLGTIIESAPGVGIKTRDPGTDYTDESGTSTSWSDE